MLSKKYYKILAELIGKSEDLEDFENKLINFLAQDNPRFDKLRFATAMRDAYKNKHHDLLKEVERIVE